jgi:hypothetical protein
VTYGYAWLRNDKPAIPGADPVRVESARIARGERWRCVATPTDGTTPGQPGSAERVIANSPPGPARVQIAPAAPRAGEPLRCEVVGKSEDPDGDGVRYRFTWQRNGAAQPFAESSQEVPPRLVKGGDRWRCLAVPTDGDLDGPEAGSAEVVVAPSAHEPTAGLSSGVGP